MKKILRTVVSLILVALLFAMAMPIYAFEDISVNEEAESGIALVKEVEELREENVKHFDMGDGTYKVVSA